MGRTLLITNDFPPRPGGIQQFVHNLAVRQPADSVVVYASTWKGAERFDAEQPFEVVRELVVHLLLHGNAPDQRTQSLPECHGQALMSTRLTAAANTAQAAVSLASCRHPARVSR